MAVPAHLLKGRSLVVLPGAKAAVRLQQAQPTFYVQSSDGLGAKLELISLKVVRQSRVVEKVETGRGGMGKPSELHVAVQLERSQLAPQLYRLKPLHPLDPGEYALGELAQQGLNLELWDFGVFETTSPSNQKKKLTTEHTEERELEQERGCGYAPPLMPSPGYRDGHRSADPWYRFHVKGRVLQRGRPNRARPLTG
jgi:hypothetical protein